MEYSLIRAAKYYGVAPWELEGRSLRWQKLALWLEQSEARADEIAAKIQEHRSGKDDG